jgi:ketosteroid isomerase-like protein
VSVDNVDLHRGADAAFNTRDPEAYVAVCDPRIELHSSVTVPGGAVYRGHDGVRRWHRDLEDVFGEEIRLEAEAYFDLGERTMSFHILRGRGRKSGAEVAEPFAHVIGWHDGLIVSFRGYAHREDALTDLGVLEDELDPIAP